MEGADVRAILHSGNQLMYPATLAPALNAPPLLGSNSSNSSSTSSTSTSTRPLTIWNMITEVAADIPRPLDSDLGRCFDAVMNGLIRLDGERVEGVLRQSARSFAHQGGTFALAECYALAVLGVATLAEHRVNAAGIDGLMRTIREQTRGELLHLPWEVSGRWLVPATSQDTTAVHISSLLLARSGSIARPWLWNIAPQPGRFLIVGTATDGETDQHWVGQGAEGFVSLKDLARRSRMPVI